MVRIKQMRGVLFGAGLSLAVMNWMVVPFARASDLIAFDLNHDTDVDAEDFALLKGCLSGPGVTRPAGDICQEADIDHDNDVDMTDFGVMQKCFTGPGIPGDPTCGGCVYPKVDRALGVANNPIFTGQSTHITVADSQQGANYQLRDNTSNAPIGNPVPGTGGTISLPTGTLSQTTTFNILAINAVWGCSVQLSTTPTVTVNPISPKNKIGVHVVIGSRNGYGPFVQQCAAAGKPVAVVKMVDDFGAAYEAKQYASQYGVETLTIGRKNDLPSCSWGSNCDLQGFDAVAESGTSPAVHAQRVFDALRPIWDQNLLVDVWEICNEWSSWWAWQADFYIAMMDIAENNQRPDGKPYRIALYGCSVGNPPESSWPDIARACARAKAHGGHILSLHEYAFWTDLLQDSYAQFGDALVLRYRRLYNYLIPRNADCPLALTEVGQGGGGGFVGTELFVQDFGWYDTELRKDPYVIGCAAWTLGNWSGANFQDALPALTQYIITH